MAYKIGAMPEKALGVIVSSILFSAILPFLYYITSRFSSLCFCYFSSEIWLCLVRLMEQKQEICSCSQREKKKPATELPLYSPEFGSRGSF